MDVSEQTDTSAPEQLEQSATSEVSEVIPEEQVECAEEATEVDTSISTDWRLLLVHEHRCFVP